MDNQEVDILIVGGGLIGATLMLALAKTDYRVILVDAIPFSSRITPDFDARSLALSPASTRIMQMLNIWPLLEADACPIETIHVSEQHAFGCAHLRGDGVSKLGHVVELQQINHALHQCLNLDHVLAPAQLIALDKEQGVATIRQGDTTLQLTAKLIVAADGTDSSVRTFCDMTANINDYHQHALVANIGLARGHQHIAYERFTTHGPLALLPMNGLRASMVWALPPDEAKHTLALNDKDFLTQLQRHFGYRLGRFTSVGKRVSYPLRQVIMPKQTCGSVVFVGNAAHTLHPVAGQGFNLGLRDVAMLAQCIVQHGLTPDMLQHYETQRTSDQTSMTRFTDGLIRLFTSKFPCVGLARRAGLIAFDQVPALKAILARHARGFAGITPDLVCQIPFKLEAT